MSSMTCPHPGMTPELEIILAEGAGIEPGYSSQKVQLQSIVLVLIATLRLERNAIDVVLAR